MEIPQSIPVPPHAQAALTAAQEKGRKALGQAVTLAKEKPLFALAVAAGIGFLLGALARRS